MQEPAQSDSVSVRPVTNLEVVFEATTPFLVLRLFANKCVARLSRHFEYSESLFGVSLFLSTMWIGVGAALIAESIISAPLALAILLPIIAHVVLPILFLHKEGISDSVGMAWALKSWVPTGLPPSYSRQEVLEHLQGSHGAAGSTPSRETYLQRRPHGWFALAGIREGDWLDAHRDKIQKAMRNRKVGLLDDEVCEELELYREVRDGWEGDDGVGIAR